VVLSSMAVYGSQEPPFDEAMWPRPEDPYGAAKAAMETDLRALGAVQGIEWLIIRPHNVYGPRQNLADPYRNVVAIFMRKALAGEPLTIFGDGSQTRAFSFVEDVADAIANLAIERRHTSAAGHHDPGSTSGARSRSPSMSIGLPRMAEWANALEIGPLRRYDYEVDRNLFAAWQAVPA
jgi:UDP-glucose 4-epimerase